jgi:phage antirepressor YoqD-like protein
MLQILQNQSILTMSTREIADLIGKTHSNIKISAERLFNAKVITLAPQVFEHNGNNYTEYLLNKRDSLILVAQNCPEFTAKIIDRWQELEVGTQAIPKSFAEALRLAADQQEVIQAQAAQIEHQKPAVEFVDRYVQSTGNLGFRQVCKLLKAKENDFRAFLQDNNIMYRLSGEWVPYAPHINAGRFYVTTGTGDNDHNFNQAKFTPKGVQWIAELWGAK